MHQYKHAEGIMQRFAAFSNINNFSNDQRTRISLFAVNVELGAGDPWDCLFCRPTQTL